MSLVALIREEGSLQPARVATMSALAGLSSAGVLAVINAAAENVSQHQPNTAYFFAFAAIVLNLLLKNRMDSTPIVTELKIRNDEDALYGLIQCLCASAHLVTASEHARLRNI